MTAEPADAAGGRGVAALVAGGAVLLVALHLLVPPLGATWAYAHLGRHAALPWLAGVVTVTLPALGAWLARRPAAGRAMDDRLARRFVAAGALVAVAVVLAGLWWPVTPICIDSWWFAHAVEQGRIDTPRWQLALWAVGGVARWLRPWLDAGAVVRGANAIAAGGALVALAAAACRIGRTAGEALVVAAVAWTAFGTAQLAFGYVDVYPVALAFVAVQLWLGTEALRGRRHPAWAVAVAALGPFVYVGLALLVPAAAVLAWVAGPRAERRRRLLVCGGVAVAVAGLATLPAYGRPVAWIAFARDMATAGNPAAVFGRGGPLLGPLEIADPAHLLGLAHLAVLVDPVGLLLLVSCGVAAARRAPRRWTLWAAAVLAPQAAYVVAMDPLFGHYADWDLFSYVAASTATFGGAAFVAWARGRPPARAGALAGLVLAAAIVHLLARLNALDVAFAAHLAETPFRIVLPGR